MKYLDTNVIVIKISEFLECHTKAKCTRAPAYSRTLCRIKGVVQTVVSPISRGQREQSSCYGGYRLDWEGGWYKHPSCIQCWRKYCCCSQLRLAKSLVTDEWKRLQKPLHSNTYSKFYEVIRYNKNISTHGESYAFKWQSLTGLFKRVHLRATNLHRVLLLTILALLLASSHPLAKKMNRRANEYNCKRS